MPAPFTTGTIEAFMRDNVVRTPTLANEQANISYILGEPGVVWAYLDDQSIANNAGQSVALAGATGKVYKLEFLTAQQAGQRDDAFKTYWVEYKADDIGKATMLGHDAEFMFTAKMTGCSFGLGSYSADGKVRAAHVNAMKAGENIADAETKLKAQRPIQQLFCISTIAIKRSFPMTNI